MLKDMPSCYRARAYRDRRDSINQSARELAAIAAERRIMIRRQIDRDNAFVSKWISAFDAKRLSHSALAE